MIQSRDTRFVSAGAGSGKTWKLMGMIREALDRGIEPESIMATTFTKAAAEEIRQRVRRTFLEAGDIHTANSMGALRIGTVDAVCMDLLKTFAFEAGISPDLTVIEQEDADQLLAEVLGQTLEPEQIAELGRLEERFGITDPKNSTWKQQIRQIIDAARSNGMAGADLPAMARDNYRTLAACIGTPLVDTDQALMDVLDAAIPAISEAQERRYLKNTGAYLDNCLAMRQKLSHKEYAWKDWIGLAHGGFGQNAGEHPLRVQEHAAAWKTHPDFFADLERYLSLVFESAALVLERFAEAKACQGVVDFVDQEVLLFRLLENPSVAQRISENTRVLFVDEFQDTNPLQLAIFLRLAGLVEQTVWVGDVKQSIYGFRGSDASLMSAVLGAQNKDKIDILDRSWRSRPSLVEWCNQVFVQAFEDELPPDQVRLLPQRSEISGEALMHWQLGGGNKSSQHEALASGLLDLYRSGPRVEDRHTRQPRPLTWPDIAILVRSNATADELRKTLDAYGIPLVHSANGLLATPEGNLVQACLRRLHDRNDTLASAEILGLTTGASPRDWLAERLEWLASHDRGEGGLWRCTGPQANPLLGALEELRPLATLLGPLKLLETLMVRCSLDRLALGWTPTAERGKQRLANLEALRSLVADYELAWQGKGATLAGCLVHLKNLTGKNDPMPVAGKEGVFVETWHKAKGLEWPVVVLHDSQEEIRLPVWDSVRVLPARDFVMDNPLAGRRIRLWPGFFGKMKMDEVDTSLDPDVPGLEDQAIREARRLLYVGCTRARDLLVLTVPESKQKNGWEVLGVEAKKLLEPRETATTQIILDNGTCIPYACKTLVAEAPVPKTRTARTLSWYENLPETRRQVHNPAMLTPSSAELPQENPGQQMPFLAEHCLSTKLNLTGDVDARELGTVFHDLWAYLTACSAVTPDIARIETQLAAHGLAAGLARNILDYWTEFRTAISKMLHCKSLHAEVPVCAFNTDGQRTEGRIDMLVETGEGWHIIDHKLTSEPVQDTAVFAALHAPQLQHYRQAVELSGDKPVRGLWIHLPLEGRLLCLDPV